MSKSAFTGTDVEGETEGSYPSQAITYFDPIDRDGEPEMGEDRHHGQQETGGRGNVHLSFTNSRTSLSHDDPKVAEACPNASNGRKRSIGSHPNTGFACLKMIA